MRTRSRRRFLATAAPAVGLAGVLASAGCPSIQQALGGTSASSGPVTLRDMAHFTALGDTSSELLSQRR